MKYTGEIEGQYRSREDPKKISSNTEDPGKYGRVGHPSLDSSGSGYRPAMGFYEHGCESSGFIKC
jgi:hypothetical protein